MYKSQWMIGKLPRKYDGRCSISDEQIEQIRELHRGGMKFIDIALKVGVSVTSVRIYCGYVPPKKYIHKPGERDRSLETYYKRKKLWVEGKI